MALAVVGAAVVAAVLLLALGYFQQRKARRTAEIVDHHGGVAMEWTNVGYVVRNPSRSKFARGDAFADGHVILDGLCGRVQPGEMLAILVTHSPPLPWLHISLMTHALGVCRDLVARANQR